MEIASKLADGKFNLANANVLIGSEVDGFMQTLKALKMLENWPLVPSEFRQDGSLDSCKVYIDEAYCNSHKNNEG